MRLLLFSNSTMAGDDYLQFTLPFINDFLPAKHRKAVFIPFAGISVGFDAYSRLVKEKLAKLNIETESLHLATNKQQALQKAEVIIIGGGNTFCLLKSLQEEGLLEIIRTKIYEGIPYIGWSAGSNLACPTIRTTNDMPIVEPHGFMALNLVPFQINPHYTDFIPDGHTGETRDMRIKEFLLMNPEVYVAGLREGSLFRIDGSTISLMGNNPCRIFKFGLEPVDINPGDSLQFIL